MLDSNNEIILLHQWAVFSIETLGHNGLESDCMHIRPSFVKPMDAAISKYLTTDDCYFLGCPHLPLTAYHNNTIDNKLDEKFPWSYVDGKFFDPVSFNVTRDTPEKIEAQAKKVRAALKPFPEGLLFQFGSLR